MTETKLNEDSRGLIQQLIDSLKGREETAKVVEELAEKVTGLESKLEAAETEKTELVKKLEQTSNETAAERAARRIREKTDLVRVEMSNVPVEPQKLAEALEWLERTDHVEGEDGAVLRERYDLLVSALKTMSELVIGSPMFQKLSDEKATGRDPETIEAAIKLLSEVEEFKGNSKEDLLIAAVERWPSLGMTEFERKG